MTEPTFSTAIDRCTNPTEPANILANLPGGIIKSNLSWIPPNPLTIIIVIVLKQYIDRACGSKNVVFRPYCFN